MLLSSDDDWRVRSESGGASRAFADIGSHLCDLIEFMIGERIHALSARTRRVFSERSGQSVDTEDIVAVLVETESGALGTLLISQMPPAARTPSPSSCTVRGRACASSRSGPRSCGSACARNPGCCCATRHRRPGFRAAAAGSGGTPDGVPGRAFNSFIADVYAAIAGAEPDGLPTFADGYRSAVLTEAVLASAADGGRWVEVTA